MNADAAAALGISGWMLAGELLTLLRDRGLITTDDASAIIARALADAESLLDRVEGEAPEGAIDALRQLLATWPQEPPRR